MFNKVTSKFKIWYAISLAVLFLGALSLLVFGGFNSGIDFAGGSTVTIDTGSYSTLSPENRKKVSQIAYEVFKENKLTFESEQFSPVEGRFIFSFRHILNGKKTSATNFSQKADEVQTSLLNKLQTTITDDTADFEVSHSLVSGIGKTSLIWRSALAILALAAIVFVYSAVRQSVPSGAAMSITVLHDVLILVALCLLIRVKINIYFIYSLFLTAFFSLFLSSLLFSKIRELKKDTTSKLKHSELAASALTQGLFKTIISGAALLVISILLFALGAQGIRLFAVPVILGTITAVYSSLFISVSVWSHFEKISDKIKGSKRYQAKKAAKKEAQKKASESA